MVISDLNYLESVAEASNTVLGGSYYYNKKLNVQVNYSKVDQDAYAKAYAYAYKGDAYAKAEAYNVATVIQTND